VTQRRLERHALNSTLLPKTIRVIGTKYDGSPRDEWPAQLIEKHGPLLRLYVPAGTEEIVQGTRHQVIRDGSTCLFWTDRWYNVWQFDRTEGVLVYANVAMPCQFDGRVLRWVDLDIDIVCYVDGSIVVKDEDEFEEHIVRFAYPEDVVEHALAARDELLRLARADAFPFDLDKECRNGRI
jgi:protein associated with RNAse G/E